MAPGLLWLMAQMIVPCGLNFLLSFYERGVYGGVDWSAVTFGNFSRAADTLYLSIFVDSAHIAAVATLIALVIGYPAAFAISRAPEHWRTPLLFLAILPFWTNYLIRTYAWIVLLNREGLVTQLLRWFGYEGEPPSML